MGNQGFYKNQTAGDADCLTSNFPFVNLKMLIENQDARLVSIKVA